jgi:hypothetical protein
MGEKTLYEVERDDPGLLTSENHVRPRSNLWRLVPARGPKALDHNGRPGAEVLLSGRSTAEHQPQVVSRLRERPLAASFSEWCRKTFLAISARR